MTRSFVIAAGLIVSLTSIQAEAARRPLCYRIDTATAEIGTQCRTQVGVVFERVEHALPGAWLDHDSGLVWSTSLGEFKQADAVIECGNVNGVIPSRDHVLTSEVNGLSDVFPMRNSDFWIAETATKEPE